MLSFAFILKKVHLQIGKTHTALNQEHAEYVWHELRENIRVGALKRARLNRTPQKVAHMLIESIFVDCIRTSPEGRSSTSPEGRSSTSPEMEILAWCRRKHQLFYMKYFSVADNDSRKEFEHMFCKLQRVYFAFARLSRIWRLKKSHVKIDTDLFMTPLNLTHKHTFCLFQQSKRYYFTARDLCKILVNALTNSSFLFSEPQIPRNPYNNIPFNKSDLYNIYWKIRESLCFIPTILELWFRYGFDVYKLRKLHEHEFANYAINNYVNGLNVKQTCEEIHEMLHALHFQEFIRPDPTFPPERFAADLTPFLRLFLKVQYYPDKIVSANLHRELICKLRWFSNVYPYYGRLSFGPVRQVQPEDTEAFITSHQYSEAKYTNYIMWGKYDEIQRVQPTLELTVGGNAENSGEESDDEYEDEVDDYYDD